MSLLAEIEKVVSEGGFGDEVSAAFTARIAEGSITRDENPRSHACVYFIPFDATTGRVFIGHHKKSGLWLFNGGHLDREDEALKGAILREMSEEWGFQKEPEDRPFLMSVTEIVSNPAGRPCRCHFDISYKVPMTASEAAFDAAKLATEFHENHWLSLREARKRVTDPTTLLAIEALAATA